MALRSAIVADKVPDNLKGAFLFELDLGTLFAGASYKGEVEERLKEHYQRNKAVR